MGILRRTLDVDKHEIPYLSLHVTKVSLNDTITHVEDDMDIIHLSNTLRKHHFHTVT